MFFLHMCGIELPCAEIIRRNFSTPYARIPTLSLFSALPQKFFGRDPVLNAFDRHTSCIQ